MTKKRTAREQRERRRQLEATLKRARGALDQDKPEEAIALLEPALLDHPREVSIRRLLAEAYLEAEDQYAAIHYLEQALERAPQDEELLRLSVGVTLHYALIIHGLRMARRLLEIVPEDEELRGVVESIEDRLIEVAAEAGTTPEQAEEALFLLERSNRAMADDDHEAALAASRQAFDYVPDWPPLRIGFALSLPMLGAPREAIAHCNLILEQDPQNPLALATLVKVHAMAGRMEEARGFWRRLQATYDPAFEKQVLLLATEAAAWMGEDRTVYDWTRRLFPQQITLPSGASEELVQSLWPLATAAANLGYKEEALQAWEILIEELGNTWLLSYVEALEAGQPGPGWMERYPYFTPAEVIPEWVVDEITEFLDDIYESPPQQSEARLRIDELVQGYPALVYLGEYLIWAEQAPYLGVPLLEALDTSHAVAVLRRFAASQAGPDWHRLDALHALHEMGALTRHEPIRFWSQGTWTDTTLDDLSPPYWDEEEEEEDWPDDETWEGLEEDPFGFDFFSLFFPRILEEEEGEPFPEQAIPVEEYWDWNYAPELLPLMQEADEAVHEMDLDKAAQLYSTLIEQNPQIKEAHHRLGRVYLLQGRWEQADALFRQAIEIDPQYVLPRIYLVLLSLEIGDLATARMWLEPLREQTEFYEDDLILYYYVRARIELAEGNPEQAARLCYRIIQIEPQYDPARHLLAHLALQRIAEDEPTPEEWGDIIRFTRHHQRVRARITTADPSLEETLAALTANALRGMAENVVPEEKVYALRKAELVERLKQALLDPDNLQRIVSELEEEEVDALDYLLVEGGLAHWEDFAVLYGEAIEDEESPYWKDQQPDTILGRLRARGLLAEGMLEGEIFVLMPRELIPLLRELVEPPGP